MPRALHLTPYALCVKPHHLRLTPCALRLAPYALRLMPYALRLTPRVLREKLTESGTHYHYDTINRVSTTQTNTILFSGWAA